MFHFWTCHSVRWTSFPSGLLRKTLYNSSSSFLFVVIGRPGFFFAVLSDLSDFELLLLLSSTDSTALEDVWSLVLFVCLIRMSCTLVISTSNIFTEINTSKEDGQNKLWLEKRTTLFILFKNTLNKTNKNTEAGNTWKAQISQVKVISEREILYYSHYFCKQWQRSVRFLLLFVIFNQKPIKQEITGAADFWTHWSNLKLLFQQYLTCNWLIS